jgi:hypothetical protein
MVQLFGALLTETLLFPVPHRHVTPTIPKLLRPYFRHHRDLLKDLCRIAHECVLDVMRISLDQPEGMPGIVMAIHTFVDYPDFHPHLLPLMADGLFLRDDRFPAELLGVSLVHICHGRSYYHTPGVHPIGGSPGLMVGNAHAMGSIPVAIMSGLGRNSQLACPLTPTTGFRHFPERIRVRMFVFLSLRHRNGALPG